MKLIDRAEKIGLIWLGTTKRTRFILQQPKHNRTTISVQVMKNQLFFRNFNIRERVKFAS